MLRTYFQEQFYDMPVDVASKYAEIIREAIIANSDFSGEKKKGYYVSRNRGFDDKLYVGDVRSIENHLYWRDEELQEDDQIVNVIVIDGPVTRDGDGCSYGSKDHRDQILYANMIPQVVGHIFIINTPGGAASSRIDYEQAIQDCREKGKPTVAWVDGLCASAGQLVASLCDRTIVMNGRHTMGCIGTMCAFWGVPHGNVDRDGYRYVELVSVTSPDKNAEYREACDGKYEKLQEKLDQLGEEFRETVRQNRPLIKEEHLTGKTFDADEVMGELVDEIGNYDRAIQAVFDLAEGRLTPARDIEKVDGEGGGAQEPGEQKDLAQLNGQQKAAINSRAGQHVEVGNGHVHTYVPGLFGPERKEIAKPQKDNDMTEEEKKKAAEAEAAEANQQGAAPAVEEKPADGEKSEGGEQPGEGGEQPGEGGEQPGEGGEQPGEGGEKSEEGGEQPGEGGEQPGEGGEQPGEGGGEQPGEGGEKSEEGGEQPGEGGEQPGEGGEQPGEGGEKPEGGKDANAEVDEVEKLTASLHTAEGLVEQKDKEIENLKSEIEFSKTSLEKTQKDLDGTRTSLETANATIQERDKAIKEKDVLIEKLTKQVGDLKAEVKELAGKPAPDNAAGGIPDGNATGGAPTGSVRSTVKADMTPDEIRAALRKQDAELEARRTKR